MFMLELFVKNMMQYINIEFDNSHLCNSRYVDLFTNLSAHCFFFLQKMHTETSVQLGSDSLVPLK